MDRYSWPFETPNVAGLMYSILCVFLIIAVEFIFSKSLETGKKSHISKIIILALLLPLPLLAVVSTGSRAGWLSLIGAIIIIWLSRGTKKSTTIFILGLFGLILALSPSSGERIAHSFAGDSSIEIRGNVWRGAISLMFDFPFTGTGLSEYANLLNSWYIPEEYSGRFTTGLNDYLTLGGAWGVPALIIVCVIILTLFSINLSCEFKHNIFSYVRVLSLAAITAIIISGQFQGHLWAWREVQAIAAVALIAPLIYTIITCCMDLSLLHKSLKWSLLGTLLLFVIIGSVEFAFPRVRNLYLQPFGESVLVIPSNHDQEKIALLRLGSGTKGEFLRKIWLNPLISDKWVFAVIDDKNINPGIYEYRRKLKGNLNLIEVFHGEQFKREGRDSGTDSKIILINPQGSPKDLRDINGAQVFVSEDSPFCDVRVWDIDRQPYQFTKLPKGPVNPQIILNSLHIK